MAPTPAEPSPTAEPSGSTTEFDVVCVCGQRHTGPRRRRHQQILCKECGTPLFVLPLDNYPAYVPGGGKGKKSRKVRGAQTIRVRDSVNRLAERTGQRAARTVAAILNGLVWIFSPVKLAIYAVILAVVGTSWFLAHRQAVATAEKDVTIQADLGRAALNEGDFAAASDHLGIAADAVRLLGRTDEVSRRIVQSARESEALANLARQSIIDMVKQVDESGVEEDGRWKAVERLGFKGKWIAFDATVEERSGKLAVTLPVAIGGRKAIYVRVDSPAFKDVSFNGSTVPLTFAGQVESVERVSSAWNVVIDPQSLFLWESPELYTSLGFVIDPQWNTLSSVTARLEKQRLWQGGEVLPEDHMTNTDGELPDDDSLVESDGAESEESTE